MSWQNVDKFDDNYMNPQIGVLSSTHAHKIKNVRLPGACKCQDLTAFARQWAGAADSAQAIKLPAVPVKSPPQFWPQCNDVPNSRKK